MTKSSLKSQSHHASWLTPKLMFQQGMLSEGKDSIQLTSWCQHV
jgi:hypothetical protein